MIPLLTNQSREYLSRYGETALTLPHAVALVLGSGVKGSTVSELSRKVAESLRSGYHTVSELERIHGLGPAKAAAVVAALELHRLVSEPVLSDYLTEPQEVYAHCEDLLREPQEHLVAFFLSVRGRAIKRELISVGTVSASLGHAREVFRAAITHNASSLILAHNHPSGDPQPSNADCVITKHMAEAGVSLGIELLDHVICAHTGWVSLRESMPGLFP
jgi:DNA repair protein RadC